MRTPQCPGERPQRSRSNPILQMSGVPKKKPQQVGLFLWYTRTDSNRRPSVPKTDALIR
jgi:hypothetical protein